MKHPFTQSALLCLFFSILQLAATAQPDYVFKNPVHKSGTALSPGAVYKFSNVKTGVDANVTILTATGGVTISSIDESWTGFDEAFQPFINVGSLANGYVEFRIDFLDAGTENLKVQSNVPATCIDVDGVQYGDGTLYEQDQVQFNSGTYDFSMTGANIQVLNPPGWITIKNTSGISYGGIDTAQHDVMTTVVNLNINSFKVRIGAINTSPTKTEVRYRSVYFKRFQYSNSILLPNRTVISFSGTEKNNGTELKGALSASHSYDKMVIERSINSVNFFPIKEISLVNTNSSEFAFSCFDNSVTESVYFYRVRLLNSSHNIYEMSTTLMIKRNANAIKPLQVYNTMVNSTNPSLSVHSIADAEASLQLTDLSGRIVYSNKVGLHTGTNNLYLANFTGRNGYYVAQLTTKTSAVSQKIIVQQ